MEQFKDKYPEWFDEEGNYIPGSLENQIERTKDNIRTCNNANLYGEECEFNLADLKLELEVLKGLQELDAAKKAKIIGIDSYDKSESVNSFTLDGEQVWLDKDTRVGLMNSTQIEKAAGRETTTLWFGGRNYTIPCDTAIQMLSALELYALQCYNVTAQHKAAVEALSDVEVVEAYDYKTGYPDKLNLNTKTL